MKAEGSQADRKHDIIEIEDSDAAEEEEEDKWTKRGSSEDTTMVAVDQCTSLITSTESPTPTTLISVTTKHPNIKISGSGSTPRQQQHTPKDHQSTQGPLRAQPTEYLFCQSRASSQKSQLRVKISLREAIYEMTINNKHQWGIPSHQPTNHQHHTD